MSTLNLLKSFTTVVADTGDFEAIAKTAPTDATTNPSLVLKVAQLPHYGTLIDEAINKVNRDHVLIEDQATMAAYYLSVLVGVQLTQLVPGRVSTEIDARLSFDKEKMIAEAKRIIDWYETLGVKRERVLIKLAATWEGIQAANVLEREGIQCNLTLIFNLAQARACGEAGVFLISPFVGRIYDWYKNRGLAPEPGADDFGVASVKQVFSYLKQHGFDTIVMGASFRSMEQVIALAGCDKLTISPEILDEMAEATVAVERHLVAPESVMPREKPMTEAEFRWALNLDPMANEKLAEGIVKFAKDQETLEALIQKRILGK